ncbi:monocarboxylate transporter 6-like [Clavelina lepadiformis]|uniref:monocarboxylate transporter 6-like n=1 Tax=Clavelina lepadiformis TaxID=159417 RepID=UPI004042BCF9
MAFDSVKAWIVVFAFAANAVTMGPMKCTGVFFLPFQLDLNATAKEASLVTSLIYGMYFFCGPIASVLSNRFGFKRTALLGGLIASAGTTVACLSPSIEVVYITLGIFIGFGSCLVLTPVYALIGQVFVDKRPLVNNIVSLGSAMSAIPLGLLVQLWIDSYGWRGSVLLLGGIVLNSLLFVYLIKILSTQRDVVLRSKSRKLLNIELLRTVIFPAYCIACGLHMASMVCVSVYLVRFAQSLGISNYQAAGLTSIMGLVDILLRPAVGYLTSIEKVGRVRVNRCVVLYVSMAVQAVTTLLLPFTRGYSEVVAVTVAYAACIGFCGALPITVLADLFGADKLPSTLGFRSFVVGAFSLATPPLIGIWVDIIGSYNVPFFASSAFSLAASFVLVLIHFLHGTSNSEGTPVT